MLFSHRARRFHAVILVAAALSLVASSVDARAGRGGGGFGSRGARTFDAPPATTTSPRQAAPIERSQTTPGVAQGMQRPGASTAATRGGFFSRNGGLMGGLIGAGLIGMLLGYGLMGGLGGFGAILGLLLQIVLIVFLVRLAFRFFQRRSQPAYAGAGAATGMGAPLHREAATPHHGGGGGAAPRRGGKRDEVGIDQRDLNEFEHMLGEVQGAYAREDLTTLHGLATPEVVGYLQQEIEANRARGVVNHVSDVKLLQGDLAESWREGDLEYATVAMRFALTDYTTERASGRVVEGDPNRPTEATELWTFMRRRGQHWMLSAIQQG